MTTPSRPISSHDSIAIQLALELQRQLSRPGLLEADPRASVTWYMSQGYARAVARESLIHALGAMPELQSLAEALTTEEVAQGKPPPEFREGQRVEVIVNAKNLTYHSGVVLSSTWHHKERKWFYVLQENGRRISKRYEARDLRPNEA